MPLSYSGEFGSIPNRGSRFARLAREEEQTLGKGEAAGSIPVMGSMRGWPSALGAGLPNQLAGLDSRTPLHFRGLRPVARIGRCPRSDTGSNPVDRSMFGGLVIVAAHLACTQEAGFRLPDPPPDVAVAESGFRRLAVNQSYVGSNPTGHPMCA